MRGDFIVQIAGIVTRTNVLPCKVIMIFYFLFTFLKIFFTQMTFVSLFKVSFIFSTHFQRNFCVHYLEQFLFFTQYSCKKLFNYVGSVINNWRFVNFAMLIYDDVRKT